VIRIVKITGLVLGIAVIVLITAGIIFALIFDPNEYKDQISSLVKSRTGRTLAIQDDLSMSFFPWIGIKTGTVIMGNAEDFGPEPFARIDSAELSIKLLPLFKRQIEIDTVKLYGLNLNLVINSQGSNNWDDLSGGKPQIVSRNSTQATTRTSQHSPQQAISTLAGLSIGGLDIRDARLAWQDKQTGTGVTFSSLNFKSGPITLNEPFAIDLSFNLQNERPAINGSIDMTTILSIDLEKQLAQANDFRLETRINSDIVPGGQQDAVVKAANINADMTQQSVEISSISLQGMGLSISGDIQSRHMMDKPTFQGTLKLAAFSPREVLRQLAIEPPETSDSAVLKKAEMDLGFKGSTDQIAIQQLSGRIDDTAIKGNLSVQNLSMPAIEFTLDIDTLDLDRYLPPVTESTAATPATAATAGAIELPLDTLRSLNLDGTAQLGRLKVANLTTTDIKLSAGAHDGLIRLHPLSANLYGGSYKGHIELDATDTEPAFSFDEQLSNIQAGPFLHDLADTDFVSGTANAGIKVNTRGDSIDKLRKRLNGKMTFSAVDGRIDGLDLLGSIQQDYASLAKVVVKDINKMNQTVFSKFSGNVTIKNGLASTSDTTLNSAQLDVKTRGTADLVSEKLDLTLEITPRKELEKLLSVLDGRPFPYYIKGTFSDPQFENGLKDKFKQIAQEALEKEKARRESELKAKAEEEKAKLDEKTKKEVDKARQKAEDKLKDLFK